MPDQYSTNQNPCQVLMDHGPLVFNILVRIGEHFPVGVPQGNTPGSGTGYGTLSREPRSPAPTGAPWRVGSSAWWSSVMALDILARVGDNVRNCRRLAPCTVRYLAMVLALRLLRGCGPGP